MAIVSIKELVEAGVHFGHRASRWNPKMAPYIFGKRNLIHIIDLRETVKGLIRSARFLSRVIARGEDVLFVGTKRQARVSVETNARRCGMPFVTERWLGGTLTNFRTITSRVRRLEELEELEKSGRIRLHSKKMIASLGREMAKMRRNLEGIRNMRRLPGVLVVVDPRHEKNAVAEARKLGIPTVCLTDTDSDPDVVDILTPGNDDAIRAILLFVRRMADSVLEGKQHAPKVTPLKGEKAAAAGERVQPADEAPAEGGRRGRRPSRPRPGPSKTTQRLPGGRVVAAERSTSQQHRGPRRGSRPSGPAEASAPAVPKPVEAPAPAAPPVSPEPQKPPSGEAQGPAPAADTGSGKTEA